MLISRRIHSQRYWVDMDICGTPWGFPGDLVGKKKQKNKPAYQCRGCKRHNSISGSGRPLEGGHGNTLQYS